YLRVMRSLDFVKTLPEWNGRDLIVVGSSQGGGQAIAAAGLDPQVTLCVAAVPALSDHAGTLATPPPQCRLAETLCRRERRHTQPRKRPDRQNRRVFRQRQFRPPHPLRKLSVHGLH
ncbi:MAG: hypothetical protein GX945_09725, partial [Lentisphaerae bacterium]|nr:hypothetical protein [Lentisphaerota bacterium]